MQTKKFIMSLLLGTIISMPATARIHPTTITVNYLQSTSPLFFANLKAYSFSKNTLNPEAVKHEMDIHNSFPMPLGINYNNLVSLSKKSIIPGRRGEIHTSSSTLPVSEGLKGREHPSLFNGFTEKSGGNTPSSLAEMNDSASSPLPILTSTKNSALDISSPEILPNFKAEGSKNTVRNEASNDNSSSTSLNEAALSKNSDLNDLMPTRFLDKSDIQPDEDLSKEQDLFLATTKESLDDNSEEDNLKFASQQADNDAISLLLQEDVSENNQENAPVILQPIAAAEGNAKSLEEPNLQTQPIVSAADNAKSSEEPTLQTQPIAAAEDNAKSSEELNAQSHPSTFVGTVPPPPPFNKVPMSPKVTLEDLQKKDSLKKVSANLPSRSSLNDEILKGVKLNKVTLDASQKARTFLDDIKDKSYVLKKAQVNSKQTSYNAHGVSSHQIINFKKNLRPVEKPLQTNLTAKVNYTNVLGNTNVNLEAIQHLEARLEQAKSIKHELQDVRSSLKKTERSKEFDYSSQNDPEKTNELEQVLERIRAKKIKEQEEQNEKARIAQGNTFKADKHLEQEKIQREIEAKKQIGKPQLDVQQAPTLLDQIVQGKQLKPVNSSPKVKEEVKPQDLPGIDPLEAVISPSSVKATVEKAQIVPTNLPNNTVEEGGSLQDILMKKFTSLTPSEGVFDIKELLTSLTTYKNFFNFDLTEREEIEQLITKASPKAIEWLKDEISKAENYDPEWDEEGPYQPGTFFTVAKKQLELAVEPEVVASSSKAIPGRMNLSAAANGGDLLSQIRAVGQAKKEAEQPLNTPSAKGKINLENTKKFQGNLFDQIRALRKDDAEEVSVDTTVSVSIPSIKEEGEGENRVGFIPPPPPPPFPTSLIKGDKDIALNTGSGIPIPPPPPLVSFSKDIGEKEERLPTVEQLNKKHHIEVEREEDNTRALIFSTMHKRRISIEDDSDDDYESDFDD